MRLNLISSLVVLGTASSVLAHGVQIQIVFNPTTGKIETRQVVGTTTTASAAEPIVPDFHLGTTIAPKARVYVSPLSLAPIAAGSGWYVHPTDVRRSDLGVPAYPTGPGLTFRYVHQTGAGATGWDWGNATNPVTNPALPNLAGTHFTYTMLDGLKSWDGSAWVDPGAEQLQLFRGDGTAAFTGSTVNAISTDAGGVSFALSNITTTTRPGATSVPHSSVGLRLLGDGVSPGVDPDDGIYLLALKLATDATIGTSGVGVGDSDPFYLVLYKNRPLGDAANVASALASAQGIPAAEIQLAVPEPTSLGVLAAGAMLVRRRR